MGLTLLNQLGEWNPQLFRELKGRLNRRNVFFVVASSLVGQLLIVLPLSEQICISSNCAGLGWYIGWHTIFTVLSWLLPLLLLFGGVYLLLIDLGKEEHQGTLNFIRLSPQSSQSILIGKTLGVPALLYLGVALALPLHGLSALADGMPLNWLLGIYTLWGAACCLCYSAAPLLTLLNRSQGGVQSQAWGGSSLAGFLGLLYIGLINSSFDWYQLGAQARDWQWFLLPLGRQPGLAYIWMLISVSVATYWFWQAANRLFRNPKATLISKLQSYWLVGSFQLWLLGFVLPEVGSVSANTQLLIGCGFLFALNPIWFLVLSLTLSPHRQDLQDWARYRHNRSSTGKGFFNRSLVQDLIRGEKSPVLGAIAINLLITATIWVPWMLLWSQEFWSHDSLTIQKAFLGLLLTMNLILIYAALAELMIFMKSSKQALWITGTVAAVIISLLVNWAVLGVEPLKIPFLWLLSPFPVLTLVNASITEVFLGLLAQLSVLGLLTVQLTRQLQKAGESTSKALFTKPPSLPGSGLK